MLAIGRKPEKGLSSPSTFGRCTIVRTDGKILHAGLGHGGHDAPRVTGDIT